MLRANTLLALLSLACVTAGADYAIDTTITANDAEGRRLAADVESLLDDPDVSDLDKAPIWNEIVASDETGSARSSRSSTSSPGVYSLKSCCKVTVPRTVHDYTTTVSYSCTTYYRQRYTTSCGLFGIFRCTRHRTASSRGTCYRSSTQYFSTARDCPCTKNTCCEGYFWLKTRCLNISKLRSLVEEARRG